VDPNPLSADHTTSVTLVTVSRDGKTLVYGIRKGGEDEVELRVFDVDQKKDVPGGLPKGRYFGVSFDKAKKGFWYSRWSPTARACATTSWGTPRSATRGLREKGEKLTAAEIPFARLSDNGRWLMIGVAKGSSGDDTRLYLKNVESNGPIVTVADTLKSAISFDMVGDQLVLTTNWKAPNQRILLADAKKPQPQYWKEIVPETPDAVIDDTQAAGGRLYVTLLQNVASKVRVYGLDGQGGSELPLPGLGTTDGMTGEWDGGEGYFKFSSFNRPTVIYRYNFASGNASPWWKSSDPFDPESFDMRQFSIKSTNGVRIPFYVVSRKGLEFNGKNRVLLHGYGGFNVGIKPEFSAFVATWLELGGVYVSANLRGGNEFGEAWHRDGMLANKQHVFDDFLNISGWLLQRGYCFRQNLGIIGDSNGGLAGGRGDEPAPRLLWRGPVPGSADRHDPLPPLPGGALLGARVRLVGGPGATRLAARLLALPAGEAGVAYPSVMLMTGDSDTRVDPLHARKMAALMQSFGGDNPVLLHYDVSSGTRAGRAWTRACRTTRTSCSSCAGGWAWWRSRARDLVASIVPSCITVGLHRRVRRRRGWRARGDRDRTSPVGRGLRPPEARSRGASRPARRLPVPDVLGRRTRIGRARGRALPIEAGGRHAHARHARRHGRVPGAGGRHHPRAESRVGPRLPADGGPAASQALRRESRRRHDDLVGGPGSQAGEVVRQPVGHASQLRGRSHAVGLVADGGGDHLHAG
jgi:prolyl oligopeptidase